MDVLQYVQSCAYIVFLTSWDLHHTALKEHKLQNLSPFFL